jgi:hypothetical protein
LCIVLKNVDFQQINTKLRMKSWVDDIMSHRQFLKSYKTLAIDLDETEIGQRNWLSFWWCFNVQNKTISVVNLSIKLIVNLTF